MTQDFSTDLPGTGNRSTTGGSGGAGSTPGSTGDTGGASGISGSGSSGPTGSSNASYSSGAAGSSGGTEGSAGTGAGQDAERKFDRTVNATHEAVDRAAESLDQAAERMRQTYDQMCAMEREWAEACRMRVRDNPLAWIAGAVVTGLVIGRLTGGRHD